MRKQYRPRPGTLVLRRALAATSLAACALTSWSAAAKIPDLDPLCIPIPEICDGIDNDCDGVIDNGNPGGAIPCATGLLGACGEGTLTCVHGALTCVPELLPGQVSEVCDEIDDDCDGVVDDGFDVGDLCYVGVGACVGEGWKVCNAIGTTMCNAVAGEPAQEMCDGIDNDCDGLIDNGNPQGGEECGTGVPGVCALGASFCDNGVMECHALILPGQGPELCDGLDNDCDGLIDEGDPSGGQACLTGLPGVCSTGVTTCVAGLVACTPNVGPGEQPEVCGDAEDSDCDGLTDNGCGAGSGGSGGSGPEGGLGGDGGSAMDCVDDTDCDDGFVCDGGQCAPAGEGEDPPGADWAPGCACRTAPRDRGPVDWVWCAAAAASVLAGWARMRSGKRR